MFIKRKEAGIRRDSSKTFEIIIEGEIVKIGLSTYTYTWAVGVPGFPAPEKKLTPEGLLKKARDYGIGVVQLCDNIPLHKMKLEELNAISKMAAEMGIELEIGTRGVEPDHLWKYLEIARNLNASLLRTMINPVNNVIPLVSETVSYLKEVLPQFENAGVSIAIENYEMVTSSDLAEIVRKVDSEFVGVCLDTVNSFGALECPDKVIKKLSPYVMNLHVKDFKINRLPHRMGFIVEGCPAGEGKLNLDRILDLLYRESKDPNVILELWTPFTGNIENTIVIEREWAEKSIAYLRGKIR